MPVENPFEQAAAWQQVELGEEEEKQPKKKKDKKKSKKDGEESEAKESKKKKKLNASKNSMIMGWLDNNGDAEPSR